MILKYDIENKSFGELRERIIVPKFQRGLVWGEKKKKEFIKTLKAGLPIGVLLLSKRDDKYLVIDGLQRFTTMEDYSNNYFKYIDQDEISELHIKGIILSCDKARTIYDEYDQNSRDHVDKDIRSIVASGISNGTGKNLNLISNEVAQRLCKEVAMFSSDDFMKVHDNVYTVVEEISNKARIDDIKIPLIIFKGKEDELADIFQKLNQEGVKLSKYDVFAATWINHTVVVKNDPKFIDFIINKYEVSQKESNLDIADYDPEAMKKTGELTVFEYAFALGKAIMNECPRLFPKKDDSKIDSIGFLILAEIVGLTYQNMGRLADELEKYPGIDYRELKEAIVDAGRFVENALSLYIEAPTKGSGRRKTSLACHSDLQLASYIIVVFKLKYNISREEGVKVKQKYTKDLNNIREHLYKHYLYDILSDYWLGSGDTKLETIIEDPQTCRYTRDIDKDTFEIVIGNWIDSTIDKSKSSNVPAETRLFLNYILRHRISDSSKYDYDIEHCVPKNVLSKFFLKKGISVPVSSVCNLTYIPSSENRGKSDYTYYQKQDADPGTYLLSEEQLDKLVYPKRQELLFVESTSELTEENYYLFLKTRKTVLSKAIMEVLYSY